MKTTTSVAARALLLGAAAALAAGQARAQDIEMAAQAAGRPLPAGYYERIRQNPGFFEFQHAWLDYGRRQQAALEAGVPSFAILPRQGEMRMVVIMAQHADSDLPPFDTEVTHQQLFGANPLGNLTDFYRQISGGRVSVTGAVLPWLRTTLTLQEVVGTGMGIGIDARTGEYMVDALRQVDEEIDFGAFDNNGPDGIPNSGDDDGFVDLAVFQYSEVAASCGGPGVWPHRSAIRGWTGQPYATNDRRPNGQPVRVDDYIMQSVLDCDGDPQTIATIAHETGHAFGLPDYYHPVDGLLPSQRRWVLGCWTLMAAGSWGCGDGAAFAKALKPSSMGAYEKFSLGWANLTVADTTSNHYTLAPVQQSGQVLLIPLGGFEYLLAEYRPRTGYDSELAAGGVLLYHVDARRGLRPCPICPRKYHVNLVEADGNDGLVRTALEGGNRGEAGDVFQGSTILTDRTSPSLALNNGAPSGLALHIVEGGGQARIHIFKRGQFPSDRVLGPMLGGGPQSLSADEQAALDAFGNQNGSYDLGDVRAWLRADAGPETDPAAPQVP